MNNTITPQTTQELKNYYHFRWKMLREPWQQPKGSEQDELEQQSTHLMTVVDGQVVAVGRMHKTSQTSGQIRYMAVSESMQGTGLGKTMVSALELAASKQGVTEISLKARESAVSFYQKLGYQLQGFSHLLYNEIRHFTMTKVINKPTSHQAELADKLQTIWHNTIPMSKAMDLNISFYDQKKLLTHCEPNFNQNLHHTMFAGSIYTLATLTGWGWVFFQLEQKALAGDIVLAEADIRYIAPIKGSGYAITTAEQTAGKLRPLSLGKKARLTVQVNIMSGDTVAATFNGTYVVLPKSNN